MDDAVLGAVSTSPPAKAAAAAARGTRQRIDVFGSALDAIDLDTAVACIADWADGHEHRVVCATNVHSIIAARASDDLAAAISMADMAVPDGAPVAWRMRLNGRPLQRRVAGPDLMWAYLHVAADRGQPIFLLGGSDDTLIALRTAICQRFPSLVVAGSYSPPFRSMTDEEDDAIVARINASGAGTVWVGLGCPKQELWMAAHRDRIRAVQIGGRGGVRFSCGSRPTGAAIYAASWVGVAAPACQRTAATLAALCRHRVAFRRSVRAGSDSTSPPSSQFCALGLETSLLHRRRCACGVCRSRVALLRTARSVIGAACEPIAPMAESRTGIGGPFGVRAGWCHRHWFG